MANEHNALKYATYITRGVKRLFGVDDHEDGVTRLSESLQLVADVGSRPEYSFPLGENRWSVAITAAAVAAQFSQCGIQNPAGSGMIIVVDDFDVSMAAGNVAIEERVAAIAGAVSASGTPTQTDTRIPGLPNPTGIVAVSAANQNAARRGTLLGSHKPMANPPLTYLRFPAGIVLVPGFEYWVGLDTVNLAITVTIRGRERRAYPGEILTS